MTVLTTQPETTAGAQFVAHAQMCQAIGARAAAFRQTFLNTSASSGGSYAATEAANATATN